MKFLHYHFLLYDRRVVSLGFTQWIICEQLANMHQILMLGVTTGIRSKVF